MIVETENYAVISRQTPWRQDLFPAWVGIDRLRYFPGQRKGAGVEPHYHDCDEFWLFISGRGEAWLDDEVHEIAPRTVVYTPMGIVHRFQMFTEFDNIDAGTRHERQKRMTH